MFFATIQFSDVIRTNYVVNEEHNCFNIIKLMLSASKLLLFVEQCPHVENKTGLIKKHKLLKLLS